MYPFNSEEKEDKATYENVKRRMLRVQVIVLRQKILKSFLSLLKQGGQYNYGQPQGYQQQNPYGPPPPASQYPPGYPGGWGGRPGPPPGVDPVLWDWFQVK